jgi:hypothetical protein
MKNKLEEKISNIIKQLENEKEVVNGNDWQSGYNNGLTRAIGLLCELYNSNTVQKYTDK